MTYCCARPLNMKIRGRTDLLMETRPGRCMTEPRYLAFSCGVLFANPIKIMTNAQNRIWSIRLVRANLLSWPAARLRLSAVYFECIHLQYLAHSCIMFKLQLCGPDRTRLPSFDPNMCHKRSVSLDPVIGLVRGRGRRPPGAMENSSIVAQNKTISSHSTSCLFLFCPQSSWGSLPIILMLNI